MIEVTESGKAAIDLLTKIEEYDHACDCDDCNSLRTHTLPFVVQAFATHRIEAAKAERDRMDAAYLEAFDVHMSLIVTNWPKIKHVPTAIALAAKTMDAMVSFQTLRELPNDVADKAFDLARVELPLMEYRVLRVVATALADALEKQP